MDAKDSNTSSCTYHMNSGDDRHSYTKNSAYQKSLLDDSKELINKLTDENLDIENPFFNCSNPFRIVDLGCSVGPNTFVAVQNIIEAVEHKFKSGQQKNPEFHVFFNDHAGNDFNTLFNNLPTPEKYFAAGVPGSFHGRLFPNASIHFAHCSTALHWLSEVPKEVRDRNSLAWNKGRIHYAGAAKEVMDAYSAQFRKDLEAFLSARAQELVGGGLMVLLALGFEDGVLPSQTSICRSFEDLRCCLKDVAQTGGTSTEKVDSFNLPYYYPYPTELKELIEANGSFNIERMGKLPIPIRHESLNFALATSHMRAVLGGLIEEHFGNEIMDDLFERVGKKFAKYTSMSAEKYHREAHYIVFLKRKVTG